MDLLEAIDSANQEWSQNPLKAQEEKEVIGKYGVIFNPKNIEKLSKEDFKSFLQFKNNKHWSGLERHINDFLDYFEPFKKTLKLLLDESIPIEQRLKRIRDKNSSEYFKGFGPSYYTPILLVVYPDKYPVINNVVKDGLDKSGIYPKYDSKDEWISYPEAREKILKVAKENNYSLWKMDWIWWNIAQRADSKQPIALCWSTDGLEKLDEFKNVLAQKNKVYWGVNWSATKLREDDYPLTGYLNYKRNIVAKGQINRIVTNDEVQKIADKNQYQIPGAKLDPRGWKSYVEFSSLEKLDNPFPTNTLELYFDRNKRIPDNLQNKVYVIDRGEGSRYWIIRPGEDGSDWQTQMDNRFAGMRYFDFGSLTNFYAKDGVLTEENKSRIRDKIGSNEKIQEYAKGSSREGIISQILIQFNSLMKVKPNDQIIALGGFYQVLGAGTVKGNYEYRPEFHYCHTIPVNWTSIEKFELKEPLKTPGTIFEISKEQFEELISKKENYHTLLQSDESEVEKIKQKLLQNKQIVLYGPPGTSKTFTARKIAVSLVSNEKVTDDNISKLFSQLQDEGKVDLVQFHPSYSYEDFVQGIKPTTKNGNISYEIRDGIFKRMCDSTTDSFNDKFFAKVIAHQDIKNPHIPEEFGIRLQQYGINKIDGKNFETIVSYLKNEGEKIEFFKNLNQFSDFFILRTTAKDNIYGDVTGERYHFSRGIPGSVQLSSAIENGEVPFFYYDLDAGGIFGCGILKGLEDPKNTPQSKVLIIDEINRGNLSKIFGELIYALEYRNEKIRLQYSDFDDDKLNDFLIVPENLYIIGTMNTADRSISLFDAAMRRRFAFVPMMIDYDLVTRVLNVGISNFNEPKLKEKLQQSISNHQRKSILSILAVYKINTRISNDIRMGREKQIGHTYLLKIVNKEDQFFNVWKYQIIPLIEEFYSSKFEDLLEILNDKIIDKQMGIRDFTETELIELLEFIIMT